VQLDPEKFRVQLPVRVLWGEQDQAMLSTLIDDLDRFVDDLTVERVADAGHWIVHEKPERVNQWLERQLSE
jgi:pimeloyl-ACP methyl ester carboxylesterase